jgi:hypothetical protein
MRGGERERIEAGSYDYPGSVTSYAEHARPTVISLTMPGDESGKFAMASPACGRLEGAAVAKPLANDATAWWRSGVSAARRSPPIPSAAHAVLPHLMFELVLWQLSATIRTGPPQWFAEAIATFGLGLTIFGIVAHAPSAVPYALGLYITSAYWFTASTSFANPTVTIARSLSDTFASRPQAYRLSFWRSWLGFWRPSRYARCFGRHLTGKCSLT